MNSKNSILLVDPEFDPNTAPNCNLLIKITANSFSYAIIDKNSNQLKAVYDQQECQDIATALSVKLKSDGYLILPFKDIKVAVYTENSISIPDELFDEGNLNQYAKFFTEQQSGNLYTRPFAEFGFTSIFTLNQFIDDTLAASLQSYKLFDHAAPVLALVRNKNTAALALDFTVGSFNAVYMEGGKLIFQKYYQTENSEEFNYYLLLMINQLKINTAGTEVCLSGIIHQNDAYYQCIEKYFKTLNFNVAASDETGNGILDDMPAHYYTSLLALDLCG